MSLISNLNVLYLLIVYLCVGSVLGLHTLYRFCDRKKPRWYYWILALIYILLFWPFLCRVLLGNGDPYETNQ
jgi:hypothetical protein